MAHLSIFKEFEKLKNIGDFFLLPIKKYKDFNSARGTVTSAATDYRRAKQKLFFVSTHHEGNFLKVERVKEGHNGNATTITMKKLESLTKQFPHDSTIYISEIKTYLQKSMKPFNDFVKL